MPDAPSYEVAGAFADILHHANRLARSPDDSGTLVIGVVDGEPFVQFAGGPGGITMDFPLVSPERCALEPAFRALLAQRGLQPYERTEDNGERCLDVDLPGDTNRIAQLARDTLTDVMGVDPSARLTFMGESVGT